MTGLPPYLNAKEKVGSLRMDYNEPRAYGSFNNLTLRKYAEYF